MATIKIQQVVSRCGAPATQKRTLDALGLKKLYHTVELEDNACVRGQIFCVKHMVKVEEIND